jgi:dUTP pyrophosphatase
LANSVGIIDAGYRGEIQAAVDVLSQDGFQLPSGLRIVQLCPPSLDSPIYVKVITDESLLGKTMRGAGGFGSTGRVGAKLDGDAGEGGDAGEQGDE